MQSIPSCRGDTPLPHPNPNHHSRPAQYPSGRAPAYQPSIDSGSRRPDPINRASTEPDGLTERRCSILRRGRGAPVRGLATARQTRSHSAIRLQILIANQPSRTAAGFRSRSVPARDWAALHPGDRLVHVLDFPEPEAGDQLAGLGERTIDDRTAGTIERNTLAPRRGFKGRRRPA